MQAQSYPLKPKIMGVDVIKQQLIERIENGDEQFVRVLFAVSNALEESEAEIADDEVIGYRVDSGEPLLASDADDVFEAIVEDVKNGNYTEVDDLIAQRSARW